MSEVKSKKQKEIRPDPIALIEQLRRTMNLEIGTLREFCEKKYSAMLQISDHDRKQHVAIGAENRRIANILDKTLSAMAHSSYRKPNFIVRAWRRLTRRESEGSEWGD